MSVNYEHLSEEEFDAIVTGELAHYAIWFQHGIVDIITNYFVTDITKKADFRRIVLLRDALTFQDQIDIVRAMLPMLEPVASAVGLSQILGRIEKFKAVRNAFAHGVTVALPRIGGHEKRDCVR